MPNRLEQITMLKKGWCSEVIWGQTDKYITKTIELPPNSSSPIFLHTKREKHILITDGELYFMYGNCCSDDPIKTYKLPMGWSWYIEPRNLYQYKTLDKYTRVIEVSSYEEDVDEFIFKESEIYDELVIKNRLSIGETGEPVKKKMGRPKGSKNKKRGIK